MEITSTCNYYYFSIKLVQIIRYIVLFHIPAGSKIVNLYQHLLLFIYLLLLKIHYLYKYKYANKRGNN
jgi:hypothetical protein